MMKTRLFCFALVSAGMFVGALELGARSASAAVDCITESNLVPPQGSHWVYHVDRATNRKCWHIATLAQAPPNRFASATTGGSKHQLSESEQEALFLEFLRWKEQQSSANSRTVGSSPQTINP
jgi:hypothetical protein